jgi:hypothetical protein
MKKDANSQGQLKKNLVLRKNSIKVLDREDLSRVSGGNQVPPDGGIPPGIKH